MSTYTENVTSCFIIINQPLNQRFCLSSSSHTPQEPSTRSPLNASPKRSLVPGVSVIVYCLCMTTKSYCASENKSKPKPAPQILPPYPQLFFIAWQHLPVQFGAQSGGQLCCEDTGLGCLVLITL